MNLNCVDNTAYHTAQCQRICDISQLRIADLFMVILIGDAISRGSHNVPSQFAVYL